MTPLLACERRIFSKNHDYNYKLFEALKLIRIKYTVFTQNRLCFTHKQTCNGEYTKHCTRSRYQLKMAAPAEVSEKRSNFQIRQFKEKRLFNIAANLTLNTMASFVILLIARTARIACVRTYRHTHIRDNYCNPLCAYTPRVNYSFSLLHLYALFLAAASLLLCSFLKMFFRSLRIRIIRRRIRIRSRNGDFFTSCGAHLNCAIMAMLYTH